MNDSGSLKRVSDLILTPDLPFGELILPGYVGLFASIGEKDPAILEDYKHVLNFIISIFRDHNVHLMPTAFDVMAGIGSSILGKRILASVSGLESFLLTTGHVIRGTDSDLKPRALRSLALLLKYVDEGPDTNGEISSLIESWYTMISGNNLNDPKVNITMNLFKMIQQPFLDIRLASFEVIKQLATHSWGQRELHKIPNFTRHMISRNSEFSKEGKEAKYLVIAELVSSSFTISVFGRDDYFKFRHYHKEGPFHVDTADPEVIAQGE